jgi:hypothetical protein
MKINSLSFAIAGALTTSIWYTLIAFIIKGWPSETLKFISTSHMIPHLENIAPYITITSPGILIGLSVHFVVAFLFFWLIAVFYNMFSR